MSSSREDFSAFTATMSNSDQFIFKDTDFEDLEFDAAAFVARYRRVITLESLREQLIAYSQHIKRQLYAIINRDYKDFITITTKLDGMDTRMEMMVKPLFSLQIDLSSLQNNIVRNSLLKNPPTNHSIYL